MINIIQIVVIAAGILIAFYALGRRNTHSGKAYKKIILMLLAAGMIVAVLFPDTITSLANSFGIGRGADLLLYALVLVFIFYVLNNYLQQQDQRDGLFRLARSVAIIEARARYEKDLTKKR